MIDYKCKRYCKATAINNYCHLIFQDYLGDSCAENGESEGEGEGLGAAGTSSQCSGALSGSTADDGGHHIA